MLRLVFANRRNLESFRIGTSLLGKNWPQFQQHTAMHIVDLIGPKIECLWQLQCLALGQVQERQRAPLLSLIDEVGKGGGQGQQGSREAAVSRLHR